MEKKMTNHGKMLLHQQRKRKRWYKIVSVLSGLVVFCATYALILPAITMGTTTYCGREEHQHGENCYTQSLVCDLPTEEVIPGHTHTEECYQQERLLVCGLEEYEGHVHSDACRQIESVLTCGREGEEGHIHEGSCYTTTETWICGLEETEGHTHTEECYTTVDSLICGQEERPETIVQLHEHTAECYETSLTCSLEEHTHSTACYSDPNADVETAAEWESSLPALTGDRAADLILVAESQIGYQESRANYEVAEDGTLKGYTRYGAWYGDPYGDWSGMFASFCIKYANIPQNVFPYDADCQRWAGILAEQGMYASIGDYTPKAGDIVFLDTDEIQGIDHAGIIKEISEDGTVTAVVGDSRDEVRYENDTSASAGIRGYGILPVEIKPEDEAQTSLTMTAEGTDYTVTVSYSEEAEIPNGAVLKVSEYAPDSEEYQMRLKDTNEVLPAKDGFCVRRARFFDISIMDGETEIEPKSAVKVEISQPPEIVEEDETIIITHMDQEGTEVISEVEVTQEDNGYITAGFETTSFSDYGTISAGESITISVGDTVTLKGTSGNRNNWSADPQGYVTIQTSGNNAVITGTAAGTATISHTYTNKGASESFTVIVTGADDSDTEKEAGGSGYTVSVRGKKKILSDDVTLHVEDYDDSQEDYQQYYEALAEDLGSATSSSISEDGFDFLKMYHIYLTKEGQEGEYIPEGNINLQVTITYDTVPENWNKVNWVGHYKKKDGSIRGAEVSDGNTSSTGVKQIRVSGNSITFHIQSFSVFPVAALSEDAGGGSTGGGTVTPADGSILTAEQLSRIGDGNSNEWQIVDGEYAGNAGVNKKESDDGHVRVQKNVIPTDVENEFLVYLSVDTKQLFEDYFANAKYGATSSNNNHDTMLGTVIDSMTGNEKIDVTGLSTKYTNSATFTILGSQGEILAENIPLYWDTANNITMYIEVNDGDAKRYVVLGVSIKKGNSEVVMLSEEAERLIMSNAAQMANLDKITDEMGEYVEFLSVVSGDFTTAPVYDQNTRTLSWIPVIKANPAIDKVKTDESKTVSVKDSDGKTQIITTYKYISWAMNTCELVYKVRLNVSKEGFQSTADSLENPADSPRYAVNNSATLYYAGEGGDQTVDFQVPYVRGLLYNVQFDKVEELKEENPVVKLKGAVFELTDTSGKTYAVREDPDAEGTYRASDLPWGTYTLTEVKPPKGYSKSWEEGKKGPWTIEFCYTKDKTNVVQDITPRETNMLYIGRNGMDGVWRIENKKIYVDLRKTDMSYATELNGAEFSIYDTDPTAEDAKPMEDYDKITVEDGVIADNLTVEDGKTYYIVENRAPDGYDLPENPVITLTINMNNTTTSGPISVSGGAGTADKTTETQVVDGVETTVYVVKIPNNPGVKLPETGGTGTLPYTLGGLGLILLSLLMYGYSLRHKRERRFR